MRLVSRGGSAVEEKYLELDPGDAAWNERSGEEQRREGKDKKQIIMLVHVSQHRSMYCRGKDCLSLQ